MQLKNYQRRVLNEFRRYLELLHKNTPAGAYNRSWAERGINVGHFNCDEMPTYKEQIEGIPSVCIKVPTGGGKTFIASCAVKTIFDVLPHQFKMVVWLVPSEAILTQTLNALNNPNHPYRQRLDVDFQSRVAIYTKEQCLNGQNFSLTTVGSQLSLLVLSYDSFRGRKDSLKSRQANGNLSSYSSIPIERPVLNAAKSSLIQTINRMKPVVIVDESHHAKSLLSLEMLRDFNPSLILELTATPRQSATQSSNVISSVTSAELKREDMVKLPVIIHNLNTHEEVLSHAIELRRRLELAAENERHYIRPIVLFQAQPRTSGDNETFDKIRAKLIELGISPNQIAIRTAEINELAGKNLASRDCPIRFIITVNALREGWDCPFAYILASLANKTSKVEVEQIVGRILRMPYSRRNDNQILNEAYVLTSSQRFFETLDNIFEGLKNEGYGKRDCRWRDATIEEILINAEANVGASVDLALSEAAEIGESYDNEIKLERESSTAVLTEQSTGVFGMSRQFRVKPQFAGDIERLRLPQFVFERRAGDWIGVNQSLFDSDILLDKENLEIDFNLIDAEQIDFSNINEEIYKIDATDNGMEKSKASSEEQRRFIELSVSPQEKIHRGRWAIITQLRRIKSLSDFDISNYVNDIIAGLSDEHLELLRTYPWQFAECVRKKVDGSREAHRRKKFFEWLSAGRIECREVYQMPQSISPSNGIENIARSLYEGEGAMNTLEKNLAYNLTMLAGVRWWHRNIENIEFRINGFINHYPDFVIMMNGGQVIMAETKGEHLDNAAAETRAQLGRAWAAQAGDRYQYFMVFEDKDDLVNGVVNMNHFVNIIDSLGGR